mgnify:CR=1 FL=1
MARSSLLKNMALTSFTELGMALLVNIDFFSIIVEAKAEIGPNIRHGFHNDREEIDVDQQRHPKFGERRERQVF